jgi:Mn-dependent DtxR family transcriptional regulator
MSDAIALSASLEDYLEAIFDIADKQVARSHDISSRLVNTIGYRRSMALADRGLFTMLPTI